MNIKLNMLLNKKTTMKNYWIIYKRIDLTDDKLINNLYDHCVVKNFLCNLTICILFFSETTVINL